MVFRGKLKGWIVGVGVCTLFFILQGKEGSIQGVGVTASYGIEIKTTKDLIAVGKEIAEKKAGCNICHKVGEPGGRCPDWQGVGGRAGARKPGMSAEAYLIESLENPGAFVVPGYPNIMPKVTGPPANLTRDEILAVVAYLESLGGTVTIKPENVKITEIIPSTASGGSTLIDKGKEIFQGKGLCFTCHSLKRGERILGPSLADIGARATEAYIRQSILEPNAVIVSGFPGNVMPQNFNEMLTEEEINEVVAFLVSLKGSEEELQAKIKEGEKLFRTRGGCIGCHQVNGEGGFVGPDLTGVGSIYSEEYLRESIVNPNALVVKGYPRSIMPLIFGKVLSEREINSLVAYLKSLTTTPPAEKSTP